MWSILKLSPALTGTYEKVFRGSSNGYDFDLQFAWLNLDQGDNLKIQVLT